MLITKSTKYRNTLKVSHADSFGLKVLGKLEVKPKQKFRIFRAMVFECGTLKHITYCGQHAPDIDLARIEAEKFYNIDRRKSNFFVGVYIGKS